MMGGSIEEDNARREEDREFDPRKAEAIARAYKNWRFTLPFTIGGSALGVGAGIALSKLLKSLAKSK